MSVFICSLVRTGWFTVATFAAGAFLCVLVAAMYYGYWKWRQTTAALLKARAEVHRLRLFATRLMTYHNQYRESYARQLFDSVAQQLAATQFELAAAEIRLDGEDAASALARPREIVAAVLQEVQELSGAIHPGALDQRGLPLALRKLARDLSKERKTNIEVVINGSCQSLSPVVAVLLFAAAEEALRNAIDHRPGLPVTIIVNFRGGNARLEVSEDSHGPDDGTSPPNHHVGLSEHLRDIVELIGGRTRLHSEAESGTTLVLTTPCEARFHSPSK